MCLFWILALIVPFYKGFYCKPSARPNTHISQHLQLEFSESEKVLQHMSSECSSLGLEIKMGLSWIPLGAAYPSNKHSWPLAIIWTEYTVGPSPLYSTTTMSTTMTFLFSRWKARHWWFGQCCPSWVPHWPKYTHLLCAVTGSRPYYQWDWSLTTTSSREMTDHITQRGEVRKQHMDANPAKEDSCCVVWKQTEPVILHICIRCMASQSRLFGVLPGEH